LAEVIDPLSENIVEANPSEDDVLKNVLEEESEEQLEAQVTRKLYTSSVPKKIPFLYLA